MKFCNNCFSDSEIQNIIIGLGQRGNCPICKSKNSYIYDTEKDSELVELFESLIEIYTPVSALESTYPRDKVQLLKEEIKYNWNIFNEKITSEVIYNILKTICSELYTTNPQFFDEPICVKERFDTKYVSENSIIKNYSWEDFVQCIKYENRFHTNCIQPEILDDFLYISKQQYKKGNIFYRARIADGEEGFNPIEMSAPPAENTQNGRANSEGIRCLYLASDENTTIHEVRANIFDYISIGKFILQEDITVVNFRKISQISPFSVENLTKYAINKPVLSKINNEIAKSVARNDSKLTYVPTQYICDYIKSIVDSEGNQKYQGIEYSSTTNPKGYNIAIFKPELFHCEDVETYKIDTLDYRTSKIT